MRSIFFTSFLALAISTFIHAARGEESPGKDPIPVYCERGRLLLSDDFTSGTLDKSWRQNHGKWTVKDGIVRGDELAADNHPAALRHELLAHNFIIQVDFRFDGAKAMTLGINDKAGHVCKLRIQTTRFQVFKDRPSEKSAEKPIVLDTQTLELKNGEWHVALLEIGAKTIVASIDGKRVAWGSHDGIDVEKASIGFGVNGEGASIKAVRIWEGILPADPEKALKKLEGLHAKAASAAGR